MRYAKVQRYSLCFDFHETAAGALRLNPPKPKKVLRSIGQSHWGVGMVGLSVGDGEKHPVNVCGQEAKDHIYKRACSVIPDSGSTFILAPPMQLSALFHELCERWPRCKTLSGNENMSRGGDALRDVLRTCKTWLRDADDMSEVPSLFFHLQDSMMENQTLELPPWTWVFSTRADGCFPAIEPFAYESLETEAVWVLGSAVFHSHVVGFEMEPASVSFSIESCSSCLDDARFATGFNNHHMPKRLDGPARYPNYGQRLDLETVLSVT